MKAEHGVVLNFGDVVCDFTPDGNIVIRSTNCEAGIIDVFLLRRRNDIWIVDQNCVSIDDLPFCPSLLSH